MKLLQKYSIRDIRKQFNKFRTLIFIMSIPFIIMTSYNFGRELFSYIFSISVLIFFFFFLFLLFILEEECLILKKLENLEGDVNARRTI